MKEIAGAHDVGVAQLPVAWAIAKGTIPILGVTKVKHVDDAVYVAGLVLSADEANFYGHYPYKIKENYFNQSKLTTKPGIYRGETVAVGNFTPNKLGLYDMRGNVGEWCWDIYAPYENTAKNPTGPES